ncbi:MAG: M42 family peptidase [Crenarchaeota archaeon]|nr:M42 family peptidase [Thermoproteota archaeon]
MAKKFYAENKPTVILDAHIDEVGLLIMHIDDNGFLRFEPLGGIDDRVLPSQSVVIKGTKGFVYGIIGAKPPHLLEREEMERVLPYKSLFIDIGVSSREEAAKIGVEEGSPVTFNTPFIRQGNSILGKAFDDRLGVYVVLEVLKSSYDIPVNIIGVFSTQEEFGLRGAQVASFKLKADYALALECTAAADTPGTPPHEMSTRLRKGPAITIADRASISSPTLVRMLIDIAKNNGIPYQFKGRKVGGTDACMYRYSPLGIHAATVSIPARYIHSSLAVADISDIENTLKLVMRFLEHISGTR